MENRVEFGAARGLVETYDVARARLPDADQVPFDRELLRGLRFCIRPFGDLRLGRSFRNGEFEFDEELHAVLPWSCRLRVFERRRAVVLKHEIIEIAVPPVITRLVALDDRMVG